MLKEKRPEPEVTLQDVDEVTEWLRGAIKNSKKYYHWNDTYMAEKAIEILDELLKRLGHKR